MSHILKGVEHDFNSATDRFIDSKLLFEFRPLLSNDHETLRPTLHAQRKNNQSQSSPTRAMVCMRQANHHPIRGNYQKSPSNSEFRIQLKQVRNYSMKKGEILATRQKQKRLISIDLQK